MTSMTAPRERALTSFPTYLLKEQLGLALMLWAAFTLVTLLIILFVAYWLEIEVSGWDQATQAVRWYALFIGVHVGWSVLPLHITHGQTRREFMRQAAIFVVVFAAALSALVAVTFVLEAGLYRLAGWPQEVSAGQLYGLALDLHLVFVQSWLLIALWTAGGLFMASARYRNDGLGALALILAIVFAGVSGIALSSDWGPFGAVYERFFDDDSIGGLLGVVIHLVMIGLMLGLTWLAVRDVPVRSKAP